MTIEQWILSVGLAVNFILICLLIHDARQARKHREKFIICPGKREGCPEDTRISCGGCDENTRG